MRDFEDVDGDCNESQPPWDDGADAWDLEDIDIEDRDVGESEDLPF